MKTLPKIWIWTSKIMPDLWLSAVFCQIKKKSLHPNVEGLKNVKQILCVLILGYQAKFDEALLIGS